MIEDINLSPEFKTNQSQKSSRKRPSESEKPVSAMQWFFLIFLVLWTIITMIVAITVFYVTKSPLSITVFSIPAYILSRITKYLFPKDARDYEIAALKIRCRRKSRGSID